MNIIWSPTSRKKIDDIVDYISLDNVDAALALVEEFESRVNDLKRNPRLGRKSPLFQDERIRDLIVRKKYLIVYEIKDDQIEILTIRHTSQDLDESDSETD